MRTGLRNSGQLEVMVFSMDIIYHVGQSSGVFTNEGRAQQTGIEISGKLNLGELAGQKTHDFASQAFTHLMTAKLRTAVRWAVRVKMVTAITRQVTACLMHSSMHWP